MNQGLELHDSELASVTFNDGDAVVSLSSACIHCTIGIPGIDAGSSWLQQATLTLSSASSIFALATLSATISEGFLRVDSTLHSNIIPASGTFDGDIELSLVFETAEVLNIGGQRITIQLLGAPRLIESFHPRLQ